MKLKDKLNHKTQYCDAVGCKASVTKLSNRNSFEDKFRI